MAEHVAAFQTACQFQSVCSSMWKSLKTCVPVLV